MVRSRPAAAVLVLVLVMAGACVAQAFGRFTYGVLLPSIRDDMLGSNGAAGLLGTINVAAYLLGTIIIATLSTRLSLVALIRIGLCLSTSGLLLASSAQTALVLGLALVLMGLGGAAIWIPSPRVAASVLPPHRRGLAAGLVGMGIGVGIVFAGQLSDVMRHGRGDEAWRDVYRVEGSIAVVVLVAAFALLRHDDAAPTTVTTTATTRPRATATTATGGATGTVGATAGAAGTTAGASGTTAGASGRTPPVPIAVTRAHDQPRPTA